ncbi:XdhC family protein [Desulfovibrio sp. TomC]|uniref:XdhC family protein n=1 Tax=Desulfovibrio sp. TomC TaxID=1562888 RepID=UPI000573ABCA|nr:XdhC/CoxI family protein [Desulfovibrio sp. TomC]KHK00300.1 Xanthine and CO dehydrogenases maturation factor, XdhC/CoxF family [Desulfovibrio sp. TomC]
MSNIFHDSSVINKADCVRHINQFITNGESVVVATLVARKKSDLRTAGSKMLVRRNGEIAGVAEGGALERKIIATAAPVFASGMPSLINFDGLGTVEDKETGISENVERIFLENIDPDVSSLHLFNTLHDRLSKGHTSLLLSRLSAPADSCEQDIRRCLLGGNDVVAGSFLSSLLLRETLSRGQDLNTPIVFQFDGICYFLELFLPLYPLYILGAGKVGRFTAQLAAFSGFRVVVMDDDPWFANSERFPLADEVVVLESFCDCFQGRSVDANSSVVVITRGHEHDKEVLSQVLLTEAGYVGMMGCKADGPKKVAQVGHEGGTHLDVSRVHCPIGLPIGGATPEEIAMSIVAELISARTKRLT